MPWLGDAQDYGGGNGHDKGTEHCGEVDARRVVLLYLLLRKEGRLWVILVHCKGFGYGGGKQVGGSLLSLLFLALLAVYFFELGIMIVFHFFKELDEFFALCEKRLECPSTVENAVAEEKL